jgi:predicted HTH transcriptional regulator
VETIKEKLGIKIETKKLSLENLEESQDVEFKSSIAWDYTTSRKNKDLEYVIAKTISAFMNTKGGLLVVGVDDKKQVLGIRNDLKLLKKQDEDGFRLRITEIISNFIGKEFSQLVHCIFEERETEKVALIQIKQSIDEPTYLMMNDEPEFFIRTSNSTQRLNLIESHKYIKKHWPGFL